MTLTDLASLGSFVSGIAVFVSLIFLGLQMRQSNRNQRALMQQGISSRYMQLMTNHSPETAKTVARVMQDDPTVEPWEINVAASTLGAMFVGYEDSFLQHKAGTLDPASWTTEVTSLRANIVWLPNRAAWRLTRLTYGEEFRAFVDGIVESTKGDVAFDFDVIAAWRAAVDADRPVPKTESNP